MERWTRIALKMLVADCPYRPVLCMSPFVPFTDYQIAKHLMVSLPTWRKVKAKLIEWGEIRADKDMGIIYEKWLGDTSDGRAKAVLKPESLPALSEKELMEDNGIRQRLMDTYNTITGGDYRHDEAFFIDAVRKRAAGGATEEDMDIALRTYLWANINGTPQVVSRMRPYAAFSARGFRRWRNMNRPMPVVRIVSTNEYIRGLPMEKRKLAYELVREYGKQLKILYEKMGWEHLWEVDYNKVSTCKLFVMGGIA